MVCGTLIRNIHLNSHLLCGRLIDRIMGVARPSVRPYVVRLFFTGF